MIVGTTGDNLVATLLQHRRHGPGVGHSLQLVDLERWRQGFLEGHSLSSNLVHKRAALDPWENRRIELPVEGLVLALG
ncbi:hypothetical protein D9M68_421270 [compost metagenome]